MITPEQIIQAARSHIGTPYQHQAHCPGVALDCIGLILAICDEFSLLPNDFALPTYGEDPLGQRIVEVVSGYCTETNPPQLGNLMIFKIKKEPQHLGILASQDGAETLIHSYTGLDKVGEHDYTQQWRDRLVASFRLPSVSE